MKQTTDKPNAISKVLSPNDTGETGGHQAGMLIPKVDGVLSFFPTLGSATKNPRYRLNFLDDIGQVWKFNFIYYNNRFFGGTRNEYRLTGMTSFIKQNNLKAGDSIILKGNTEEDQLEIHYERYNNIDEAEDDIIHLGSSWKVINI
ncbi:hypothetical protein R50345_30520 [Paenibacillus sp. FSL R5-0345]|uniref:EcoRII N-terminal effector-binding domain-containing protein n=1 Tax=Paenibacillus sp. FSL R5-0345 TaxID=1536770 RepID=UPI0004F5B76E|nr:EcoRII N-terminal effector-binding domain-containing protein [Paenibacillus sp. FSL R5-0345]AIQ38568.1 hypothetical protein R50345_30520 [Paenibacillus sp. FSL R5-0345]